MFQNFKKALKKEENKRIFSNFMSLSFLQGANLILPLITFPYLVRVLGMDKYGLVVFAQAFISYFALIANYGFNLSGTREVSLYKNNFRKLTKTYNSILLARLGLVVCGFLVMTSVVLSINRFTKDWELYFLTYGMIVGNLLFPIWFFQGMEKMRYITILTLIAKLIFTISIFIMVKSAEDYLWVPVLNSTGAIFSGIISLIVIYREFKVPFKLQKIKHIADQLQKGWFIFISNISINVFTATTTFVLGLVTNNTMVGYYSIAEKVIRIIQGLFTPVSTSIYPHMIQLTKKSRESSIFFVRNVLKYTIVVSIGIWLVGILFATPIFHLLFGEDVNHSIQLFRILSPLIIVLPVANILFNVVLLSFKLDKYFFRIYVIGALLNIILLGLLLFALKLSTIGATISLLVCELVITFYAALILYKKRIKVFVFYNK